MKDVFKLGGYDGRDDCLIHDVLEVECECDG